jgi:CDP-diglyceride synthetase
MLARRGSQIIAFTKRDAVRLGLISTLLVAGLTFVLAFEDLTTIREPADVVAVLGWLLLSVVVVTTLLAWLWRFRSRLWHRNNAILLVSLALLTATTLFVITSDRSVAPFLVPTAAVGLLLAVLLDSGIASVVTAMVAIMPAS